MLLEESEIVGQQSVVQRIVAEVKYALNRSFWRVFYHPFQVLGLKVGNAHVLHNAFVAQLYQCGQSLVNYQLQSAIHIALELNVVYVYQVYVVNVQSLHTLVNALLSAFSAVVPCVNTIVPVSAYFGR